MRLKRLKYLLGMGGSAGERILSAVAIVVLPFAATVKVHKSSVSKFLIDLM